jgi:hypothetical protein
VGGPEVDVQFTNVICFVFYLPLLSGPYIFLFEVVSNELFRAEGGVEATRKVFISDSHTKEGGL